VVTVQVGEHDDVRVGGVPGRSLTPDSTKMTDPGGQHGVEQEGCVAILTGDGAVSPPCHRAAHGVPALRDPGTAAISTRRPATIAASRLHMSAKSSRAIRCADLPRLCIFDSVGSVERCLGPAGRRDEPVACSNDRDTPPPPTAIQADGVTSRRANESMVGTIAPADRGVRDPF
jgi:hypothetical protein